MKTTLEEFGLEELSHWDAARKSAALRVLAGDVTAMDPFRDTGDDEPRIMVATGDGEVARVTLPAFKAVYELAQEKGGLRDPFPREGEFIPAYKAAAFADALDRVAQTSDDAVTGAGLRVWAGKVRHGFLYA